MAGILGNNRSDAEMRIEAARKKAAAEARADVKFGQNFGNRLAGYNEGLENYLKGGLGDLIGNVSGFFGDEDTAARLAFESDELYRRGGEFFDKGLAGGQKYLDESSIPITPQERSARESALAEQLVKKAQAAENTQAGEFAGMGTPLVDPMASGLDVEYQAENARQLQEKIAAIAAKGGKGRGSTNEQIGERDAFNQVLDMKAKKEAAKNDPMGDYSGEEPTVDLFMQAMADGNVAQGKEQPKAESREDLLEKYKQEFADATGIDISGKPDTSQALMAMGLSMMQNRAGKGFNVGRMLSAVGEAGEKAMPYVTKAASEAKAATAAAGKYALQKITNNENAEKAVAAATLKAQREFALELMKLDNAREVAAINSSGKANKIENVSKLQPLGKDGGVTFSIGNVRGESKFANAAADVGSVTRAWDKYSRGQAILQEMKTSLDKIESADSTALDGIYESVISSLDKLGISDAKKVFEEGVGPRASFNINRQSMINGFKRLLLQESQVSDLDLRTMTASFGNADIWSSIPASQMAIDNMMVYFGGKKKTLEHPLTIFSDRDFYTSDAEFDKVMKHLEKQGIGGFGGVSNGASIPAASNVDGVSTVRLG
jgi:hypothetical protein